MEEKQPKLKGQLKGKGKEKYKIAKKTLEELTEQDKDQILKDNKNISKYSIRNQLMILLQHKNPTILKGFVGWKNEGRKPLKDTGIFIYQPILKGKKGEEEIKGYFLGAIFDISDTEPIK